MTLSLPDKFDVVLTSVSLFDVSYLRFYVISSEITTKQRAQNHPWTEASK